MNDDFSFRSEEEKQNDLKYDKDYLEFENQQKIQQEIEDRQHYSNFKQERIRFITERISGSDINTKFLVSKHPEYIDEVTDEDLEKYKEHYEKYLKYHKAFLNNDFYKASKLTEKEHCIKYKYSYKTFQGVESGIIISNPRQYTIHDLKTAKYIENDSLENEFKKEFKL